MLALGTEGRRGAAPERLQRWANVRFAEDLARMVFVLYRRLAAAPSLLRPPTADPRAARAEAAEMALRIAATFGSADARQFADLWLSLLPELPPLAVGGVTLRLLRSIAEVRGMGRALENCLDETDRVLGYLIRLTAFFAVEGADRELVGMISMRLERFGSRLLREVAEAEGPAGVRLPQALTDAAEGHLDRMAREAWRFEPFVRVAEALAPVIGRNWR